MRDKNSMGELWFLAEHVFWAVIWMVEYKFLFFRSISGLELTESRRILWAMVIGCSAWGICRQRERHRNMYSVMCNLVTAFGMYTVIAYMPVRPVLIRAFLVGTGILAILYVALIQLQPVRTNSASRRRKIRLFRLEQSIAAVHNTVAVGMTALLLTFFLPLVFGSTLLNADVAPTNALESGAQEPESYIQTLLLLQEEEWQTLTVKQKLDVLQTVANLEQSYLGLPNELNVSAENTEENVSGYYRDDTHQIVVSLDDLLQRSAGYVLDTVCHEAYHSYQHRLTELYAAVPEESRRLQVFRSVESYAREFGTYEDGQEDFDAYYSQACETDARDYAEKRVSDYEGEIWLYLTQTEEEAE